MNDRVAFGGMWRAQDFPPVDLDALRRSGEQLIKAADLLDAAHEWRVKARRGAVWSSAGARPVWDERLDSRIRVGHRAREATRRVGEASLTAARRLGELRDQLPAAVRHDPVRVPPMAADSAQAVQSHLARPGWVESDPRVDQIVRDARGVVEHLIGVYHDEEKHIVVVQAIEVPEQQFAAPAIQATIQSATHGGRPAAGTPPVPPPTA